MKRTTNKMLLSRETVRLLNTDQLELARGGAPNTRFQNECKPNITKQGMTCTGSSIGDP